jgi:DNA-binding GntR family transcriptional regulator
MHHVSRLARPDGVPDAAPVALNETLGGRVYALLRERLIAGTFQPGEKLSLRSLAHQLGVSVQPVRHAVSRLIGDEALEVAPNRAVRVPIITAAQFAELTSIRLAIEGFAVECAAQSRSTADLATIRRFDRAFRRECGSAMPDAERAVQANQALHFAAYRAAAMPALMPIIEGLWLRIGPVLNLDMRASPERLQMGFAEACHAEMLAALEERSGERARAALERDIRTAASFIQGRGVLFEPRRASSPKGKTERESERKSERKSERRAAWILASTT